MKNLKELITSLLMIIVIIFCIKYYYKKNEEEPDIIIDMSKVKPINHYDLQKYEIFLKSNNIILERKPTLYEPKTQNFSSKEFMSKDGYFAPMEYRGYIQDLMDNLEVIRYHLNKEYGHLVKKDIGLLINSGFRTPEHNIKIGGSKSSYHVRCMAADIRSLEVTPTQILYVIKKCIKQKLIHNGGLTKYTNFVHYDLGNSRTW